MADATSKLNILITAKNEASSVLNQIKADTGSLQSAMSGVATALGVGLAGFGAEQLGSMVVDMARAGAEAERLAAGFDTLAERAGTSGDAMLSAMRTAAQGTISDSQLMLDANTAMLLGVTQNTEQMTQLMETAAARGHAMGESTAQAFGDIVEGIGRLSPRILDNLGIVLDANKVYADYAAQHGTVATALTQSEQKQALLNQVIKDSTDLVNANKAAGGDMASNFERMDTALTNAKEALGQLFAPAIAVIAQQLANAVNATTDALVTTKLTGAQESMHDLGVQLVNLTKEYQTAKLEMDVALLHPEMMDQARQHVENVQRQLQAFGLEYNKAATIAHAPLIDLAQLQQGIVAFGAMAVAVESVGNAAVKTGTQLELMANLAQEAFNALVSVQTEGSNAIAQAAASAGTLFAAHQGGDAGLAKQKAVTEELQAQRREWREMGYTEKDITDVLLPAYIQNLNQADQATFQVATHTAGISTAVNAASQAFDDLKSKVQGVLSGALDPGVGVDPASLLPRPDAINEDARRLADVAVNGWASPWADYFQKEFPDLFKQMTAGGDIKTAAAQLLQNFQDGLEPELIDKDKVKERVKRMILGEQNMADLAQEIASELSTEMGVPLQTALAAAQGTIGGGTGMGSQVATQFSDGATAALDDTGGGGNFVNKFIDQARAQYPLLSTAGKDAGKLWGQGFLDTVGANVPPALIKILVDLVSPGVMAAMAQKATLTGATP